jgi:alkanesulfonate monooxygenase SsuD/methylene tetrahydromethanopterin reductase-like flavin-dependent oxidoreductase (luciferase family)
VRGLLERGEVEYTGEFFSCRGALQRGPRPPVELGLGVLRPAMARLAGEVADVAITWLTPARYVRDTVIPALRAGAEAAGRPVPRVVAIVPTALAHADRDPVELALTSNAGHMRLPHYVDMLGRSGIDVDMSDPQASGKALVAGGAFLYGDVDDVVAQVREFADAGVDEVALNLTGVTMRYGTKVALPELETLLGRVTS